MQSGRSLERQPGLGSRWVRDRGGAGSRRGAAVAQVLLSQGPTRTHPWGALWRRPQAGAFHKQQMSRAR